MITLTNPGQSLDLNALLAQARSLIPRDLNGALVHASAVLAQLEGAADDVEVQRQRANALCVRGMVHRYTAQYGEALDSLNAALALYERLDDADGICESHYWMGAIRRMMGDFERAVEHYQRAYELAKTTANLDGQMKALNGFASLYNKMNDYASSVKFLLRAVEIARQVGDQRREATLLMNLCMEYTNLGDLQNALEAGLRTIALRDQLGLHAELILVPVNVGRVYGLLGHWDEAERYLLEGLERARTAQVVDFEIEAQLQLGRLYASMGRSDEALAAFLALIEQGAATHMKIVYVCYRDIAEVYKQRADFERALEYTERYLEAHERLQTAESDEKLKLLEVRYRTEQAAQEAAHYRQRVYEVEQQREQERRYFESLNQLKDEFLSTASHDLKTPLTRIIFNLDLVRRRLASADAQVQEYLDRIDAAAKDMGLLVGDLLDLARVETGRGMQLAPLPLLPLLHETVRALEPLASRRRLRLRVIAPDDLVRVEADAAMLRRVFDNLISNAIKYTREEDEIEIRVETRDAEVSVAVHDSGAGIPADELPYIFERFYRGRQASATIEGTGLGLAIAQSVIKHHGGTIAAASTPEGGTTFEFTLRKA